MRMHSTITEEHNAGNSVRQDLGSMTETCPKCYAGYFKEEKGKDKLYVKCCNNGKIHRGLFPSRTPLPELLQALMDGSHPLSKRD